MIVLGVDPGLSAMGYGVVKAEGGTHQALDWGVIHTTTKTALSSRLLVLYKGISSVIEQHRPDVVACEALIFAQNVKSALALGQARGVALLAAAEKELTVVEYSPKEIKLTVVGQGNASKEQVTQMVKILLGLRGEQLPTDAGDALGVALSHALNARRKQLLETQRRASTQIRGKK